MPGFGAAGQAGQRLADAAEPAADPGGGAAGRAGRAAARAAGGRRPGGGRGAAGRRQAMTSQVQRSAAAGSRSFGPGPAEGLLEEPERVLKEQARLHT